ncbi:MAG TPA: YdcF family protein [Terriglobia bacterium]|nr:YdcF family protein [Terriglobia bacterium]
MIGVAVVEGLLYQAIRREATRDEARPAGAIVVFGAAQYNGAPSPVFKARLDQAFDLEEQGLAPLVITTGGSGGDPRFTEAGVGEDYLVQKGVDAAKILPEDRSETTYESVAAVSSLLRQRHAQTCLVVSDGFHLYRVKRMFEAQGITAYASPSSDSPIEADPFDRTLYTLREMLLSTLWHLGYRG